MRKKEDIVGGLAGWSETVEVLCDIRDALVRRNELTEEDNRKRWERMKEQDMKQEEYAMNLERMTVSQEAYMAHVGVEPPSGDDIEAVFVGVPDDVPEEESDGQGEEEETEGPAGD